MPNINDIIQRILIEGDRQVTAAFNRIGDAGEAAFAAISGAVQKVTSPLTKFQANLGTVEDRAKSFGSSLREVGTSLGSLTTRVGVATAGIAAGGGLVLKGMLNVATAVKEVSASLIEQRLAAGENAKQQKKDILTNFEHANALEDLFREFVKNKISAQQYSEQLQELRRVQARQLEQQRILAVEQEDIRQQHAKDEADAQKRQLSLKLEAKYGASLAGVLEILGNVLDSVRNRFLGTFGPRIAQFLTAVVQAIQTAAPEILAVFEKVATSIENTFKRSKLSADDVIKGFVKFGGDIANIVITIIIPAVNAFIQVLQKVAELINQVFGTNFTAGTLIAAALILKISGLFGVFVGIVKLAVTGVGLLWAAFGPLGIVIGIVVAIIATQLIPLLAKIDWASIATMATDAWNLIVGAVTSAVNSIKSVWTSVVDFFKGAISSIIGFFNDLIAKVKEFLGLTGGSAANSQLAADAGLGDIGKFAGGGLFRGRRGNDRNIIAVSDNEYIVNPKAVRHWGVGFLNAINAMANPLRGFAAGGLVSPLTASAPTVSFAPSSGGGRQSGRALTLVIGDQRFEGLTVQDDTAENMARYAARRGVRSTGRRPLWFGGSR